MNAVGSDILAPHTTAPRGMATYRKARVARLIGR